MDFVFLFLVPVDIKFVYLRLFLFLEVGLTGRLDGAIFEKGKSEAEIKEKKSKFCVGQIEVEMPIRYTIRAIKEILIVEYLSSELLRVQIISLRLEIKSISCSVEMTLKALRMDKINKISVSLHRKESQALVPGYFNMKV